MSSNHDTIRAHIKNLTDGLTMNELVDGSKEIRDQMIFQMKRAIELLESLKVDPTTERFLAYYKDADNWSGAPLMGGNIGGDAGDKGYVTNMKKRGWIYTETDRQRSGDGHIMAYTWIYFTEAGHEVAKAHGLEWAGY
jgi:hypothetical protein